MYTETEPKTQRASNADVDARAARKNSRERLEPRKKPREKPDSEEWPLLAVPGGDYKSTWPLRPDRSSKCLNIHR